MKATIWHNPNCGTSRKTLAILEETPGLDVEVVEYLKTPPTAERLAQLYKAAGMSPQEGLRLRGTDAEERVVFRHVVPEVVGQPAVVVQDGSAVFTDGK